MLNIKTVSECDNAVAIYKESRNPNVSIMGSSPDGDMISIPHAADTTYLGHGYFRYIGKYPPQIVSHVINNFDVNGPILDPMVGGGTTLVEARLRGIDAVGCDINPVSRLISRCVSAPLDPAEFEMDSSRFLSELEESLGEDGLFARRPRNTTAFRLNFCSEYFTPEAIADLSVFKTVADGYTRNKDIYQMVLFSILRKISRANIKKMNLEIDKRRTEYPRLFATYAKQLRDVVRLNTEYAAWAKTANIEVIDASAESTGLQSDNFGAVFLHPPYLTNTAFSEFTQLQLALLGINHKDIWKRELRCRGSFLHETNGLKKYLVGWKNVLAEAVRVLRPGGTLVTVIGDGQIDYVRIPLGAITTEFGRDLGLSLESRMVHLLNNNTGQTQSRRMSGQHIAVFRKAA